MSVHVHRAAVLYRGLNASDFTTYIGNMWCVPMADDLVDTVAEDRIEDKELDGIEDSNPILGRTIIHWQPH